MRSLQRTSRTATVVSLLTAGALLAGCASAEVRAPAGSADAAAWSAVHQDAAKEGAVTVYANVNPDLLKQAAKDFQDANPGITVTATWMQASEIYSRVETELALGTPGADVVLLGDPEWMRQQAEAGNFLSFASSPQLTGVGAYDAASYATNNLYFEYGANSATFGWNSQLYPAGLKDYADLLNPALAGGKIGIVDARSTPAATNYYRWLEAQYGPDFLKSLAAQKPRIYAQSLQVGQAVISGEVAAGIYCVPVQLRAAQRTGAPAQIGFAPDGTYGAPALAAIPKSAPHPAAAVVFADFLVTPAGQRLLTDGAAAIDIPEAAITLKESRSIDPVSADELERYRAQWDALFR